MNPLPILQPNTIDELVRIDEAIVKVSEQQQTIAYVRAVDTFYWLNADTNRYEKLERFD